MANCTECPAGSYAPASGASTCVLCPAGQFQNTTGATDCSFCVSNSTSTAGSQACQCDAGFSGDGISSCQACGPGKYRFPSSVTCSGPCPCTSSSGLSSGVLSDGPGNAGDGTSCGWLISAIGDISIRFTFFDLGDQFVSGNEVVINRCESADCNVLQEVARLSSQSIPESTTYFSSSSISPADTSTLLCDGETFTPSAASFMQVLFTTATWSMSVVGFEAEWSVVEKVECVECPAGSYAAASGAGVCTLCQAGKYSNSTGATSAQHCLECAQRHITSGEHQ